MNSLYLLIFSSLMFFNSIITQDRDNCKVEVNTTYLQTACPPANQDNFKIKTDCKLSYSKTVLYNRWGNSVFEEENTNKGFDGTWKGDYLPDGTYFYKIDYQIEGETDTLNISGYMQIHR